MTTIHARCGPIDLVSSATGLTITRTHAFPEFKEELVSISYTAIGDGHGYVTQDIVGDLATRLFAAVCVEAGLDPEEYETVPEPEVGF